MQPRIAAHKHPVKFRPSKEKYALYQKLATAEGRSVANWIEWVLDKAIEEAATGGKDKDK